MVSFNRHWWMIGVVMTLLWCGVVFAQEPPSSVAPFSLTPEEEAWLDEHRDLRIGMWLGSPPTMFRGESGRMEGMIPDYMAIVIRKLGLEPKPVRASSFAALWQLAKAHEVDMVAAVTGEPERKDVMALSEPYLLLPIVIATRSDFPFISGLADLEGRVVAMGSEHVPHLRIPQKYPGIIPLLVDSPEQGLQAIISGRADAMVAAQSSIAYLAREHRITNVRIAAMTEFSYRLSIGVRKDWPMLVSMINRALASITEEERKGIHDYWTVLRDSGFVELPKVWRMVGGVALGGLFLLALVVVWNRRLAMEVRRRAEMEEKLRKAHEATQEVIESADIIIVGLDYTGHVKLLNSAGEAVLGYSREELVGQNWFELVVPKERFLFVWEEFFRLTNAEGNPMSESFENPVITKSGETRHISWLNSVTDSHGSDLAVISFGTDITNRLQAEEELRLTQFAMDNAAVGVFRIRPSGRIVYANRSASKILGHSRTELKTLTMSEVVSGISRDSWPQYWEELKQCQKIIEEQLFLARSGASVPVEVTLYYLMFKGSELAIGFFSDISERKRIETLRDDVERIVRHDLRSPVLAMQTLFKLLGKADNLTESQHELLESVERSSRRMSNIIDMSRALHLMEIGRYELHPTPVDVLEQAKASLEDLGPLVRAKKITVKILVEDVMATSKSVFMVDSEPLLIYALLANLLKNGVEASPEGGTVTLNCIRRDGVLLTIHNDGVIPEPIRETFFEKYVTVGKRQGTGLGTYTARLIVITMDGDIDFVTSETRGTTISITLPEVIESYS